MGTGGCTSNPCHTLWGTANPCARPTPPHGKEAVPQVSSEMPDLKNRPRFAHEPGGIGKKGIFGNSKKDGGGEDREGLIPSRGACSTA